MNKDTYWYEKGRSDRDEEVAGWKGKVEFYREATDKVREFIFGRNDIGEPTQPLYDAIYDKLTEQEKQIEVVAQQLQGAIQDYNYWKARCEAAEKFLSLKNRPYCYEQEQAFNEWQKLKNANP